MSTTSILVTLAVFAGVAAVGLAVLKAKIEAKGGDAGSLKGKFKVKVLLTANELEFLGRLETAVPEYRFCPQVAMGALLDPAVSRQDGKEFFRLRGMFSQKIVDFVAQDRRDGKIVAIIELDDSTHDTDKDAKRDIMLASAGYRIIRWHSKTKPDGAAIRSELTTPPPPRIETMIRANKNNDSSTIDKKKREKIMAVGFLAAVVAIVAIVLCLAFIKTTVENMFVHTQDRQNAVIKIIKDCAKQTKASGLTNADAIKANNQCSKQKIAELDAKR